VDGGGVIAMDLHEKKQRLDVKKSDVSGSSFDDVNMSGWRVNYVNLSGLRVTKANLAGASITESHYEGMTINGIAVTDMMAAYKAAQVSSNEA
jgi:uncharacterized protein YjbI with pentapeptide repeats